jgi:phosphoenolpyruvate-protein kinase (PTS system EI component)
MVRSEGLTGRIRLGFTLEVPALLYVLPELMVKCRPAFIAVGTSDLFAFINAIDRSHSSLKVDPFSPVNQQVVSQISGLAAKLGARFFFCGELRHRPAALREFVARGCTELIAGPSALELGSTRTSSRRRATRWSRSSATSRAGVTGQSSGTSTGDQRLGRLTTMPSWLLRAMMTTASSSVGFSSRCGTYGGTKM